MDFYGCHFEYAGVSSTNYGLIFANVDTSPFTSISGETETVSVFNRRNKKLYYVDTLYDDSPLSFEAEIVSENEPIDPAQIREIEKWLFKDLAYKKLYIDIYDSNYEWAEVVDGKILQTYLCCKFVKPAKIEGNGGIMGWSFTVECDAPIAWQDAMTKTFDLSSSTSQYVTLDVDTDIDDYVYPTVTVKTKSGDAADLQIVNITDDAYRLTTFVSMSGGTTIVIDGEHNMLSGDSTNYYEKFKNKNFIRLVNGENKLSVSDNVESISFEWQNMRRL